MNELYDGRTWAAWMDELGPQTDWTARHLLATFALLGVPRTFLDVGCGNGTTVQVGKYLGATSYGVDQLVSDPDGHYFHHNLTEKFILPSGPVEMVYCLEVAEHLHDSAHATLADTCANNLAVGRGNFLVFSCAYPNQGGSGHISERPAKYWLDQFALRDLNYRKDLTTTLALLWSHIDSPLYWLPTNVLVFEK